MKRLVAATAAGCALMFSAQPASSSAISLTATGFKRDGGYHTVDLKWSGAVGGKVRVWRDGAFRFKTANDGFYRHNLQSTGARTLRYKVCNLLTKGGACSNEVTVTFEGAASGKLFTNAAWLNNPIGASPVIAGNSSAVSSWLKNDVVANIHAFGVPIYYTNESVPKVKVTCKYDPEWGDCMIDNALRPIPADSKPSPGDSSAYDGAMSVINTDTGESYDFWQARKQADGSWTASFGCIANIAGDGRDTRSCNSTGASIARAAGVVTTQEIRDGHIPHALVFSSNNVSSAYQYPAVKSDQNSGRSDALIMGQRIQLDPSINCAGIAGITRGELTVCKALQTYGAYVIDGGGATAGFVFEVPFNEDNPYPANGFSNDYYNMPHIPWGRIRVLRSWDGQ